MSKMVIGGNSKLSYLSPVFAYFSHTEGDMPSIAVTPLPHLQMMRNFRDGEVLTGVAQSTGNLLTSTCTALLDFLCFT